MKKYLLLFAALLSGSAAIFAQEEIPFEGQSCTSILVGRLASTDGSVVTSHTCDGRYRTWAYIEPAADYPKGSLHDVRHGTMHTAFRDDTTGVRLVGQIPEATHTYAYLNTGYPCLNEKQLAIGETTFDGPDTLKNPKGMFTIEELERVALQRCDNARDAIRLIGRLIKTYGYGDSGECITIADKKEVWQMEIMVKVLTASAASGLLNVSPTTTSASRPISPALAKSTARTRTSSWPPTTSRRLHRSMDFGMGRTTSSSGAPSTPTTAMATTTPTVSTSSSMPSLPHWDSHAIWTNCPSP